jgi:hypothetical protein
VLVGHQPRGCGRSGTGKVAHKADRPRAYTGAGFCAQNVLKACSIAQLFGFEMASTSIYAHLDGEPPVRIELTTARLQGD